MIDLIYKVKTKMFIERPSVAPLHAGGWKV